MSGGARGGPRARRIDERDRALLLALLEHKLLSTGQIKSLFFRSLRRAQARLKDLKQAGYVSSFEPKMPFGEGRAPEHHFLTREGLRVCARARGVAPSALPWVPDHTYEDSQNLRHRMGVNAFFCALVEASLAHQGHCLHTWRAERAVRTTTARIKPDGFGRYLHPGGAVEFYLEYDRDTEGRLSLAGKLEGYLALAAGWGDEEATGFPTVLVVVPRPGRERDVGRAFSDACRAVSLPRGLRGASRSSRRATRCSPAGGRWERSGSTSPPRESESRSLSSPARKRPYTTLPDAWGAGGGRRAPGPASTPSRPGFPLARPRRPHEPPRARGVTGAR
ncbi:MAG: replication-relaxation family protein [Actinomycetota bacterium]